MLKVYFVTSNRDKLNEVRQILGMDISHAKLDIPEIQSIYAKDIIEEKARQAYRKMRKPVIVEDTGLYLRAMNWFPGALIKFLERGLGYEGICRLLDRYRTRGAYAEVAAAFFDGKEMKVFSGRIDGTIAKHPRGKNGFGWDVIFIPKGYNTVFAEMSAEDKHRISMRKKTFSKMKVYLKKKGFT